MVGLIIYPSDFVLFGESMISIRYLNFKLKTRIYLKLHVPSLTITLKFVSMFVLAIFPLLFMIFGGLTKDNYFTFLGL